tara:strand:- start:586 stop:720 length:135 start_codon:yes stop_codon:yes gene_type:complete
MIKQVEMMSCENKELCEWVVEIIGNTAWAECVLCGATFTGPVME